MYYVLIKNRHKHHDINDLPALFDYCSSNQIFDYDYHKKIIHKHLQSKTKGSVIHVYLTGLTPLLLSVINYCHMFSLSLVVYHYDTDTNSYRSQTIL